MKGHTNFQTIQQNGRPAFVVIPYDEFILMAKNDEKQHGIPHEVIKLMLQKEISRIRAWREYLGFTQREIAAKMGITQAALSQIELIDANPRKQTLNKIAQVLGVDVEQLR
jgi:DNA-binding XRE family transcriptional regulator